MSKQAVLPVDRSPLQTRGSDSRSSKDLSLLRRFLERQGLERYLPLFAELEGGVNLAAVKLMTQDDLKEV